MSDRTAKLIANEATFRAFNEGIREVEQRTSDASAAEFVCECSGASCEARIRVPLDEYEQVRTDPLRFMIKDGHEVAALERVVRRAGAYTVVEKHEGDAGEAVVE